MNITIPGGTTKRLLTAGKYCPSDIFVTAEKTVIDNHTSLLLHGESLKDSSQNAVALTNSGVTVSNAQSKFGGSSLYFNGSANLTFSLPEDCFSGTHDWTVDWWEYRIGAKTSSAVFCRPITSSASSGLILCDDNGQGGLSMYESSNGSSHNVAAGVKIGNRKLNEWVHRAVVKSNGVYTAYENGAKVTSVTYTGSIAASTTPMRIGNYGTSMFYGYIDEFRISDVARWTANFTPPTEAYPSSGAETGGRLPAGYTELSYIESSGTQFFETGFTPNQDTRVVMDFDLTAVSSEGWASLFSTRPDNSATRAFALYSNGAFTSAYDVYANAFLQPNKSLKGRHLVDKNKNVTTLDGTVISTFTYATFTGDAPLRLLWESSATPQNRYPFIGKLYSCQIYDNGTLVRDYVPCRNPYGVVGLYDLVNSQFYGNAGTGEFIGNIPVTQPPLPIGYTQLEYIQSSGTQYIDTGFVPNNNSCVIMDAEFLSTPDSSSWLFGCRSATSSKVFDLLWHASGYFRSGYNAANTQSWQIDATTRRTYKKDKETTTIDGTVQSYNNTAFDCAYNLYLMALSSQGSPAGYATVKLYSCQIYDNGTLVRDFIPCKNASDVVGLYDAVGGRFYGNAGTGSFTGA